MPRVASVSDNTLLSTPESATIEVHRTSDVSNLEGEFAEDSVGLFKVGS